MQPQAVIRAASRAERGHGVVAVIRTVGLPATNGDGTPETGPIPRSGRAGVGESGDREEALSK